MHYLLVWVALLAPIILMAACIMCALGEDIIWSILFGAGLLSFYYFDLVHPAHLLGPAAPAAAMHVKEVAAMGFLAGAFALGTFWFWALCIAAWIAILALEELEFRFGAGMVILASLLLLQFFGDIPIFSAAWHHWAYAFLGMLGYFVLGGVWSVFKWTMLCLDEKADLDERGGLPYASILNDKDLEPEEKNARIKERLKAYLPDSKKHMAELMSWMAFWPWSVVWFFLSDFIQKIFKRIYTLLQRVYERVTEFVFRHEIERVEKMLAKKTEGPAPVPASPQGYPGDHID